MASSVASSARGSVGSAAMSRSPADRRRRRTGRRRLGEVVGRRPARTLPACAMRRPCQRGRPSSRRAGRPPGAASPLPAPMLEHLGVAVAGEGRRPGCRRRPRRRRAAASRRRGAAGRSPRRAARRSRPRRRGGGASTRASGGAGAAATGRAREHGGDVLVGRRVLAQRREAFMEVVIVPSPPEGFAAAGEQGAHGAGAAAERLGDRGVGEVVDVAQRERGALAGREAGEQLERARDRVVGRRPVGAHLGVAAVAVAAGLPQGAPDGDAVQPRVERPGSRTRPSRARSARRPGRRRRRPHGRRARRAPSGGRS